MMEGAIFRLGFACFNSSCLSSFFRSFLKLKEGEEDR